jgi:hypothetical protein
MKISYLDSMNFVAVLYPPGNDKQEGKYADVISNKDSPVWLGTYPNLRLLDAGRTTGNTEGTKQPRISTLHWFNRGGALKRRLL